MARYIDADALKDFPIRIDHYDQKNGNEHFVYGIETVIEYVDHLPTADVVEVVRCRNCKYWQDNNGGYPHDECRWGKGETPDEDDYCSYGERKEW